MQVVEHIFRPRDLVAGHPALDFVNTVTARDTAVPVDWLDGYDRLLEWAALSGLLADADIHGLQIIAAESPGAAGVALDRAKQLREALHRIASALAEAESPPPKDLERFERAWKDALTRSSLTADEGVRPTLSLERSGLDLPMDALSLAAADLLRDFPAGRSRICRGERCGWLFIDTSKAGRRVWCDMATCGNAAKSQRHAARRREA